MAKGKKVICRADAMTQCGKMLGRDAQRPVASRCGPVYRASAARGAAASARALPMNVRRFNRSPSLRPDDSAVNRNGRDHLWLERHPSTPLGGQERLGLEVANPEEDELPAFDSLEAHSAEAHMGGAAAIIGEDDLVGRQGNLGSVSEDDGRSRGTVLQDRQLRHDLWLAGDAGTGNELDEQRIRVHSRHPYAGPRRRTRWLPEPK